jgi:hypothetical protein
VWQVYYEEQPGLPANRYMLQARVCCAVLGSVEPMDSVCLIRASPSQDDDIWTFQDQYSKKLSERKRKLQNGDYIQVTHAHK